MVKVCVWWSPEPAASGALARLVMYALTRGGDSTQADTSWAGTSRGVPLCARRKRAPFGNGLDAKTDVRTNAHGAGRPIGGGR